ncbi:MULTISPECIES: nitroreductase family protein [Clostridium]|uniref:Nitroreductase A n=1 Tax=Clostridium ragsdalei P11 TaxID=1353534 RepID=A0A1A6B475_9CLOT|nr:MULTISPECIES: nitroreductase family protein [Clostridium]OBR97144.1 nitroreductase A [Clostridium ragsdalei P11]QXE20897.1 nitroreductase [Clostridium sp. 001]
MEMMKAIAVRKSTRNYKSEQISDDSLNIVLNAGCAAPVGMGAYDSVHLTVIQNSTLLDKITKATANAFGSPNMKPFYGAPTLIVVSGKANDKAPHIEIANAACVIENMALAATDIGLGSVYLWGFLASFSKEKELLKELNLPEGFVPVSGIALGYPTEPLTKEKELKQTIKINTIK